MENTNVKIFNRIVNFNMNITPKLFVLKYIEPPPHIKYQNYSPSNSLSIIRIKDDIEKLKYASKIASKVLYNSIEKIKKGLLTTGDEVDKYVHQLIIKYGCYPSSLGFHNFPKSLCISPNDSIVIYNYFSCLSWNTEYNKI